jgi:HD-GYP domain-containing protein (c-di-GMP phosphodiesterase class II)
LVDQIVQAARIHDLGKMGIANELLFKPGALSAEEVANFRQHPVIGAEVVSRFPQYEVGKELIVSHHEHFDGRGYPHGLKGQAIPLGARIIAVADAFDAMTSTRPYRHALSQAAALGELDRCSGSQFDPQVVDAARRALPLPDFASPGLPQ